MDMMGYGRVLLSRMKFRVQEGGRWPEGVEKPGSSCIAWWLVMFCLAPKAKNTHPWEIVLKGAKRAPGAYFAVIGRRKSDLLIIEGCS